jgi:hypothetical protein
VANARARAAGVPRAVRAAALAPKRRRKGKNPTSEVEAGLGQRSAGVAVAGINGPAPLPL